MTYRRGRIYWSNVKGPGATRRRLSLETVDAGFAKELERMLQTLRDRREWEILSSVLDGRLSPGDVYDYWRYDDIRGLTARLNDVDLRELVDPWQMWLTRGRVRPSTAAKYLRQLRSLIPSEEPFLRSELTRARVTAALHELEKTRSGATVRRYYAAWSKFFRFLVDRGVIESHPARGVVLPPESDPRERYLSLELSLRLVEAHPQPFRALAALREGAGGELGAALATRRRDVQRSTRIVHLHGTKRKWRDRRAIVDPEFWEHLDVQARTCLPDALLWGGITPDAARHQHRKACHALRIDDYRMHDSRHSYAVRHMRAGDDPSLIAHQLGHKDATMVLKVYGKYRPTAADLRRLSGANRRDDR